MIDDRPNLGSCCECGNNPASVMLMLHRHAPIAGTGWGCVQCGLPHNGAIAVLCNDCLSAVKEAGRDPHLVCVGFASANERTLFANLSPNVFDHNESKHPEHRPERATTFDPECLDLAEYFLQDEPTLKHRAHELAADIQSSIEFWIDCERGEGAAA